MPGPIHPVIGWPTPDTVLVSKSDMVEMMAFVQGLKDWIEIAATCLENR